MGSKLRTAIPRCGRARETQDKADDAEQNSMFYGFARRESSSDVATSNSVNDAISEGQQKERIRHRLTPRRKNSGEVQQRISSGSDYDDEK